MKVRVDQVTFLMGQESALVSGRPVNDPTKIVIAVADPRTTLIVVAATMSGGPFVVDVPDESIRDVLEAP